MLTQSTYTDVNQLIRYLNETQTRLHDFLRPKMKSKVHLDLLNLFRLEELTQEQLNTVQDWVLNTKSTLAETPIVEMPMELAKLCGLSADDVHYTRRIWKFTTRSDCDREEYCHCSDCDREEYCHCSDRDCEEYCHCSDMIWEEDLPSFITDFVGVMEERGYDHIGMLGSNMGWRRQTGTAECKLDTKEILRKLSLNTDFRLDIEWDITTNTLHVSRYHHDAPTGEFIEVMAGYQCERWQQFIPPEEDAVGLLEAFEEGAGGSCGYLHLCREAVDEIIDDLYSEVWDLAKQLTTASEFLELGKVYSRIYELQSEVASLEELVKEHEWYARRACNLIVDNIGEPINYDLLQEIKDQLGVR